MHHTDELDRRLARLENENNHLRRAVEELSLLNDLARAIVASLNSQEIMQTLIQRCIKVVNAEQGVISLLDKVSKTSTKTLVRTSATSQEHQIFHANQSILGWMLMNKSPLVMNEPHQDPRFSGVNWDASIHNLICIPLLVKSELIGVLTLFNKNGGSAFSKEDQRLLAIIAAQSAQIIENARLYEEEKALNRMREELNLAFKIQTDLLPKMSPEISGYEIAGKSLPARNVGGDYFDFIPLATDRLGICVADVTGKGLPAALLMANLQATIRAQALVASTANECLNRANDFLYRSTDSEKFATVFYGILDHRAHRFSYSNAGHNPPILLRSNDEIEELHTGGIMLGSFPGTRFDLGTATLFPGDVLVLYSDGISEAEHQLDEDQEFGVTRLIETVRKARVASAQEIINRLVSSVEAFSGGKQQSDDITLVVVKKLAH